jgi:cytochrome P450
MSNLVQLEPFVDSCSSLFCTRLSEFAAKGQRIQLGHWLQCYAFDVIGKVTVGQRFGFLDEGEDISGIMTAIERYLWYMSHVGVYSEFHPFLYSLQAWLPKRSKHAGVAAIKEFTARHVTARQPTDDESGAESKTAENGDFLSKLLKLHDKDPEKLSMRDVSVTCETNVGAGSDTTGISLSSIIYHIYTRPAVLAELRKELDEKAETGDISDPVTFAQAQMCHYLQAVIKEALRVHPAAGLPLMRVVPEGGRVVAGRKLSAGVRLLMVSSF